MIDARPLGAHVRDVDIAFDPAKDAVNIAKHGVSLARAAEFEFLYAEEDRRFDYPEVRYRGFGLLDGLPFSLAFTLVASDIRALSLRRSHLKEFRRYVP